MANYDSGFGTLFTATADAVSTGSGEVIWAPFVEPTPTGAYANWSDVVTAIQGSSAPETTIFILADPNEDEVMIPGGTWTLNNTKIKSLALGISTNEDFRADQILQFVYTQSDPNNPCRLIGCSGLENIYFRGEEYNTNNVLTSSFSMPGASDNVTIALNQSNGLTVGSMCYINSAGMFQVISVADNGLSAVVQNLNQPGNASPTTTIDSENQVFPDDAVFQVQDLNGLDSTFTLTNCDFRTGGNYVFGTFHVYPSVSLFLRLEKGTSIRWYSFRVDGYMAAQSDGSPCWMGEYVFFGFGEVDTFPQAGCFVRPNQYVTTWTQYQSYTVYNPSTSGNWDGNPTSINEALDRLAAACVAAGHTP